MRASFALKDSHCHRLSNIDFNEEEQLMSVYIYILMVIVSCNSMCQLKAIDQ